MENILELRFEQSAIYMSVPSGNLLVVLFAGSRAFLRESIDLNSNCNHRKHSPSTKLSTVMLMEEPKVARKLLEIIGRGERI